MPKTKSNSMRHVRTHSVNNPVASFQPAQKHGTASCLSNGSQASNSAVDECRIYDKWAKSVVRNILETNENKAYRESATRSYHTRSGMQSNRPVSSNNNVGNRDG